jgi:hypothetical protein
MQTNIAASPINDVAFDDADDVCSIRYRLHPIDVGFDLREIGHVVDLGEDDPLRVSYPNEEGHRRVLWSPRAAVAERLRALGFKVL